MNFSPEELNRLPKWAVSKIQRLENENATLVERLNLVNGGQRTTVYQRVDWNLNLAQEKRTYLDPRQEVVFMQDDKYRAINVRQGSEENVKYYGPHIRVMGAMDGLLIAPECSNVVRISLARI